MQKCKSRIVDKTLYTMLFNNHFDLTNTDAIFYPFQRGFINFFLMIKHNVAPKGLKAFNTTLYNANIQLKLLLNQNL